MQIVRYLDTDAGFPRIGVLDGDRIADLATQTMAELLRLDVDTIRTMVEADGPWRDIRGVRFLAPVDGATEVWAAGVTYRRSQQARIEESTQQSVYELVYDAERPELFFKSAAWRVMTDGDQAAIRGDSAWNVPEPELAIVVNHVAQVVGYLVCNDLSSRSIEGDNPLYLPQAKVYAGACALSAGITPAWHVDPSDLRIAMSIERASHTVWHDETSTSAMHRSLDDLVHHLFLAENFPDGAVLSTGTGIVPDTDFTLAVDDVVTIDIDGVGRLRNTVVSGREHFAYQHPDPRRMATYDIGQPA